MQKIQSRDSQPIRKLFLDFCMAPSQTPEVIEELIVLIELLTFIVVSFRLVDVEKLKGFDNGDVYLLVALLACLVLRGIFLVTIIRVFYILAIIEASNTERKVSSIPLMSIFLYMLTFINIMIEIFSRIQFNFLTANPHSETLNQCKFIHFFVLTLSTLLSLKQQALFVLINSSGESISSKWISALVTGILFIGLILIKSRSSSRSIFMKDLLMRFYSLCIVFSIRQIVREFSMASYPEIIDYFVVLAVSQGIYGVVASKYHKIEVDSEISNGYVIELVFKLLSYYFGSEFDINYQLSFRTFFQDFNNSIKENEEKKSTGFYDIEDLHNNNDGQSKQARKFEPSDIMNKFSSFLAEADFDKIKNLVDEEQSKKVLPQEQKNAFIEHLYDRISELLMIFENSSESPSSKTNIYILQIYLLLNLKKNILKAKKQLERAKQKCHCISFVEKICLYKIQHEIYEKVKEEYERKDFPHFRDFLQNQKIRINILKNSFEYLHLWEYLQESDAMFKKVKKLLQKVIKRKNTVDKLFREVPVKCITTVRSYIQYLTEVRRSVKQANRTSREFEIFEESHNHLNVDKKLYISIFFDDENFMTIQKIGFNTKKLLGYERKSLIGANISILLPSFYRKFHENVIEKRIKNQFPKEIFIFEKSTIARHQEDYYIPCHIQLKLVYNIEGELLMEGFLHIDPSAQFQWNNYFFMKSDTQQLIEVGYPLKELIDLSSNKIVHYSEYFDNYLTYTQRTVKSIQGGTTQTFNMKYIDCKFLVSDNEIQEFHEFTKLECENDVSYQLYVSLKKENHKETKNILQVSEEEYPLVNSYMQYLKQFVNIKKFPVKFDDFQTNIPVYLEEKKKILKKITKKTLLKIIIATLVLILGVTVERCFDYVKKTQDSMIYHSYEEQLQTLIQHHNTLNELVLKQSQLQYNRVYSYPISSYNYTESLLILQKTTKKLEKYSDQKFGVTVPGSAIFFPKKLSTLVSDIISNIYFSCYKDDDEMAKIYMQRVHGLLKIVYNNASNKFLEGFEQKIAEQNFSTSVQLVLLGVVSLLIFIVLFLICLTQKILREEEYEILNSFTKINSSRNFIVSINLYLGSTAGGTEFKDFIQSRSRSENKSFLRATKMSEDNHKSQFILSERENSSRGLCEEETNLGLMRNKPNLNNRFVSLSTMEKKREQDEQNKNRKIQRMRSRSNKFTAFWVILALTSFLVYTASDLYFNFENSALLEKKSFIKISGVYKNFLLFSDTIASYSDAIIYQDQMIQVFKDNLKRYRENSKLEIVFEEVEFPQFGDFADIYEKMNFAYLCTFNDCNPDYESYVNILYFTTIQKLNNYMQSNYQTDNSIQNDEFELRALFYAHQLLQSVTTRVLQTYSEDFHSYKKVLKQQKQLFFMAEIFTISAWFITLIIFYFCHVIPEKKEQLQILNLVSEDSYEG